MSIESKEIKDLHEIYQNLQEGPMSGAVLFDKKEKPIIIKLKNGGTKKIFPAHPDYAKYKSGEKTESGSGEGRIKIDSSKGTNKTGSSDVSADKDLKDVSRDSSHTDASGKEHLSTAEIRAKNEKEGGSGLSNIDPKEGNAKIDGKEINPDFGKKTDIKVEKPYRSPANIKTNQNQSREFAKNDPKVKLNQFSRTSTYTADDKPGTQVQRSTVFTKHYQTGKELGVMTRNQRRAYDLEAAKFKANQANQNNSTPIKTDSSSSSSTTFDSNRVKDGNKGVKKTIIKNSYDAYDLVLNYLLETNQVDTIEEANYVMTQMDESTIQGIINEYA